MKTFLKVVKGKVEMYNLSGCKIRTYYNKTDAVRADFYDEKVESVLVHLSNGKLLIINRSGAIIKTI